MPKHNQPVPKSPEQQLEELRKENQFLKQSLKKINHEFGSLVLASKYSFDITAPILGILAPQDKGFNPFDLPGMFKEITAVIKANPERFARLNDEYFPTVKRIVNKFAPAFEKKLNPTQSEFEDA
ncbi:MAG: hypothetical protein MRZ79_12455 [Bacteroidia bacterium]|nr:hypothetical protein [Bacteroidia bacterium]